MAREYKLRLPREVPEATSENVAQWIEQAATAKGKLAADPGGGPVRISLSLDQAKVVEFANDSREKVYVALRRLIATHAKIEPIEEGKGSGAAAEAKEHLPEKLLPRNLRFEAEDFLDFVQGGDKVLAFLYRRVYRVSDLKPAETPAEDRKLCDALAEVVNRRSPRILLENADLARLGVRSVRWAMAQTESLDARVMQAKSRNGSAARVITIEPESQVVHGAEVEPTSPDTPAPAPSSSIVAEELQNLEEPVQQEGEF